MKPMETSIQTDRESLSDLKSETREGWTRLATQIGANFSLFPEWTEITAQSHKMIGRVELLTVRKDHQIVAVYPIIETLRRSFGVPIRILDLVSNQVSYHNQPVSALDPKDSIELLIDEAKRRKADVVRISGVPDELPVGDYLRTKRTQRYATHILSGDRSPYLPLCSSWDKLLGAKAKKFRYKVRKRAELLETADELSMRWYKDPDDCDALLENMRVIEGNSWKKDAGYSIFDRENERRYHEQLLPYLATNRAMFANVLFRENSPIAYNLCCVWDKWIGQMKTSFDTRFADLSPGSIVIDQAIRHSIELEASEFDFLGDTDPHKLAWTKSVRAHGSYYLYLKSSVRGRILGTLKNARLRLAGGD